MRIGQGKEDSKASRMPKKKTGARKKAEKQRARQKEIRSVEREITKHPSNFLMVGFLFIIDSPMLCDHKAYLG